METQDPPLPPNPELLNRQPKWFKPVFFIIVASVLFIGAILIAPITVRAKKAPNLTEAFSNARQIGLVLEEFETEYGTFPNDETVEAIPKINPSHGYELLGTSSNSLFRQFFTAQLTQSEQMFYARIRNSKKPDGEITTRKLLEPGEVGFAYISGLSSKDDPLTPIVLTPLIPGTTKFDPKPFDGKAIILHIDNTVRTYDIHKDGHIYDKGIDLLSAKHPIWNGIAPTIHYPE